MASNFESIDKRTTEEYEDENTLDDIEEIVDLEPDVNVKTRGEGRKYEKLETMETYDTCMEYMETMYGDK